MKTRNLSADELLTGSDIAVKLINENPNLSEATIDIAISRTYTPNASPEAWLAAARMMIALQAVEDEGESDRLVPRSGHFIDLDNA